MNNVSAASVITKAQLKLEPTSALRQSGAGSCAPRPMAGLGTLAHGRLKGGPRQKKESMDQSSGGGGWTHKTRELETDSRLKNPLVDPASQ